MRKPRIWLLAGSQHLYGKQTIDLVEEHAKEIAGSFHSIVAEITYKEVLTTPEEITTAIQEANYDNDCIGIITWMHTFSPAKMWINGLRILHKPLLHLHTQFNRDIPWETIDMDFMNLNQSAHGDREAAHIMARMRIPRKTVVGHYKDPEVVTEIDSWTRAALGWHDWQQAKFVRFGDNMRQVAVTEGDKVEAQIRFGFEVNGYGMGDLSKVINSVTDAAVDQLCENYADVYSVQDVLQENGSRHESLRDAARIELGLRLFLDDGNFKGFTTTFEDLHGLQQLPGLAVQRLMANGYGFAAEGDWKTAAVVRLLKTMSAGLSGGNSFMEDYTYHLEPGNEQVLGAHMLEICPSIASAKPRCEIHPLSIGGKSDPVRLVFDGSAGKAINISLVDMGAEFRLLLNEVEAISPVHSMPRLPVARVIWKPQPDMRTATHRWLEAGGAHHTCFSQNITSRHIHDFARIAGVDLVTIQ